MRLNIDCASRAARCSAGPRRAERPDRRAAARAGFVLVLPAEVRQLVRWIAAEQPAAVGAAHYEAAAGKRLERGGHRRAPGSDELPEDLVRQRERQHDPLRSDATPA